MNEEHPPKAAGAWQGMAAATLAALAALGLAMAGLPGIWAGAAAAVGLIAGWALALRRPASSGEPGQDAAAEGRAPLPSASAAGGSSVDNFCPPIGEEEKKSFLVEGELSAAREIQMRLVPSTFPPIPGCPPFDLYAMLDPAREIGGDFYDFWLIGGRRLAVVVGDVSGKGVPAALFMAMTRTYLRAFSRYIHTPAELVERLNREVSRHNPGCMFVTIFCGMIDLPTGRVEYSNAGHNPPYRKVPGQPPKVLEMAVGPPVGFAPEFKYDTGTFTLEAGETLLLYTDGVTESMDPGGGMLGEEEAVSIFSEACDANFQCRNIVMQLRSQLAEFSRGADQYDDITILAYRQLGADKWDEAGAHQAGEDFDGLLGGDSALATLSEGTLSDVGGREVPDDGQFMSLSDVKLLRR